MLRKFWAICLLMQLSFAHGAERNMNELLDIDLAWGGFYAGISKDSGEISVFRMLDFNQNAYHIVIYKENFQHIPSEKEILSLSPYIGHAPIDSKGLLNYDKITLINTKQLTSEDLIGYMYYLEEFEVSEKERKELSQSLINYSKEPPLKLRLAIVKGELQVSERN